MRVLRVLVVAALATTPLVACEASEAPGAESDRAAPGAAAPAEVEAELAEIDHSGVLGSVETDRDDEDVTVSLFVEGLRAGEVYSAHIHDGRCAAGGTVRVPLGQLTGREGRKATLTTRVPAGQVPADSPLFVQVHAADGQAVACADLETRDDTTMLLVEPSRASRDSVKMMREPR